MKNLETDLFEGDCYDFNEWMATFENCKMLVDFGPVKIDSHWSTINIRFQENRVIEFFDVNETVIHIIPYKLTPDIC